MKNKYLLLISAGLGVALGCGLYFLTKPEPLLGHWKSQTRHIYPIQDNYASLELNMNLEFRHGNKFDIQMLANQDLGYAALGNYRLTGNKLSLQVDEHQSIQPERELSLSEKMLTHIGRFNNDNILILKRNDSQFMIFNQYSASLYQASDIN